VKPCKHATCTPQVVVDMRKRVIGSYCGERIGNGVRCAVCGDCAAVLPRTAKGRARYAHELHFCVLQDSGTVVSYTDVCVHAKGA